jgi:hypothetical protein
MGNVVVRMSAKLWGRPVDQTRARALIGLWVAE